MRVISATTLVSISMALTACTGTNTADYRPATMHEIRNEKVVDRPFARVWDEYVAALSKEFFVINNISKDSRIINISFESSQPGQYVDCGETTRTVNHLAIGTRTINYKAAESSQFVWAGTNNSLWNLDRRTRMIGRANIYLAPEGSKTLIRVNARYAFTVNTFATSINPPGRSEQAPTITIDFTTQEPGTYTDRVGTARCSSRGELERKLLGLVN
ncbi:MAG: hypothetical protein AB7G15_20590 [Alphaproteobacteria bacterium]